MSLYNMLHGFNALAGLWLALLKKNPDDFGRFRDAYLSKDKAGNPQIAVYTRCGGGNRPDYENMFTQMRAHPLYLRDEDEPSDGTYATIYFRVPDELKSQVLALYEVTDNVTPAQKFQNTIEALRAGKETPATKRATDALRPVVEAISTWMKAHP